MANMDSVRGALGNSPCRTYINDYYNVNLIPEDCRYYPYQEVCSCCGTEGNTVGGFAISGLLEMFTRRAS